MAKKDTESDESEVSLIAAQVETLSQSSGFDQLGMLLVETLLGLVPINELILDVNTPDFKRPPLFKWNVSDAWAKRYNEEFHRLNPTVTAFNRLLESGTQVVRRFEDLCPEPLEESDFYQQYMRPQNHRHSLLAGTSLVGSGGSAPCLSLLCIRYAESEAFLARDLAVVRLLLPAVALTMQRLMRMSETWSLSVLQCCFGLSGKLSEVGSLVALGYSNKDIAEKLSITVGTAKHYVHQILEQTGTISRSDLCRLILS